MERDQPDPSLPSSGAAPATPEAVAVAAAAAPVGDQPPGERLGRRAVHGSLWTVGSYAAVQFIRLASNLVITRLFAQELLGVVAIVTTVMVGIRFFSDVGIGPALVSNPRGEQEAFLRTAFTTQVVRGFAIWLVAIAIAWPVAQLYARTDPAYGMLSVLLPVAGFVAVIEGFRSTAVFRLQRHLRVAELALIDTLEIVVVVVTMIGWGYLAIHHFHQPPERAVWALVIPPLLGCTTATVVSHLVLRDRRDGFGWDAGCARELLRVGQWIFVSTLLTFFAGQFDRLIFGKLVDARTLAVYGVAATLAVMPSAAVLKVGHAVLFPMFARVAGDAARFASVYRRARTMLLTIGATIVCGMVAAGPFAVHALYAERFESAGWMLQLLAVGVWFQIVDATNIAGLLARERSNWMAGENGVKVAFMFALVPLAYHLGYGFGGALVALAIADGLRALFSTLGIGRLGLARGGTLLPDLVLPVAAGVVGLIALELASLPFDRLDAAIGGAGLHRFLTNAASGALAAAVVVAVWGPICVWQWRRVRRPA